MQRVLMNRFLCNLIRSLWKTKRKRILLIFGLGCCLVLGNFLKICTSSRNYWWSLSTERQSNFRKTANILKIKNSDNSSKTRSFNFDHVSRKLIGAARIHKCSQAGKEAMTPPKNSSISCHVAPTKILGLPHVSVLIPLILTYFPELWGRTCEPHLERLY